jgi:hypothetical protein
MEGAELCSAMYLALQPALESLRGNPDLRQYSVGIHNGKRQFVEIVVYELSSEFVSLVMQVLGDVCWVVDQSDQIFGEGAPSLPVGDLGDLPLRSHVLGKIHLVVDLNRKECLQLIFREF